MKNSALTTGLLAVLTTSVLASIVLCYLDTKYSRELRSLNMQFNAINTSRNLMGPLVGETVDYSKTHPSIDPILESTGLKPKPASASTNKTLELAPAAPRNH